MNGKIEKYKSDGLMVKLMLFIDWLYAETTITYPHIMKGHLSTILLF